MKMKRRPAIDGKIAIITGASSGIGESTAREFARAGAITVLAARRLERLERLAEEIREMGGSALPALRGALAICGRLFCHRARGQVLAKEILIRAVSLLFVLSVVNADLEHRPRRVYPCLIKA